MELVIVWFVMTGGSGYIAPQDVRPAEMRCGLEGAVVGVKIDRVVNPTVVRWPDPKVVGQHCEVDISQRVNALSQGEYHIATTIVSKMYTFGVGQPESYIGHDPHTSVAWMRDPHATGLPIRPSNLRVYAEEK